MKTGLVISINLTNLKNGRIIEMACSLFDLETTLEIDSFHHYINTPKNMVVQNEHIHGISSVMLGRYGRSRKEVLNKFLSFLTTNPILIGHNIEFILTCIQHELIQIGVKLDKAYDTFCTLVNYKNHMNLNKNITVEHCYELISKNSFAYSHNLHCKVILTKQVYYSLIGFWGD